MKKYWCSALSEAYPEAIGELFSFHSKDWWRHLWGHARKAEPLSALIYVIFFLSVKPISTLFS